MKRTLTALILAAVTAFSGTAFAEVKANVNVEGSRKLSRYVRTPKPVVIRKKALLNDNDPRQQRNEYGAPVPPAEYRRDYPDGYDRRRPPEGHRPPDGHRPPEGHRPPNGHRPPDGTRPSDGHRPPEFYDENYRRLPQQGVSPRS